MLQLITSILLTLIPFILVFKFKNKFLGFSVVFGSLLFLHTLSTLVTQSLGAFNYLSLFSIHLIVIISAFIFFRKKDWYFEKNIFSKENLFFIASLLIILFQFISVHFNYTGLVSNITGGEFVFNESYTYPYFSDEWVAVYAAEHSIENNTLPWSKFFFEKPETNFFLIFHSFIGGQLLFFDLDPLTNYVYLGIFFGSITAALIFVLLRSLGVSTVIASITMLLVPFVTNSANLPMLWYLLPWNIGFIFLLLSFVFMVNGRFWIALIANIVSAAFYPPMVVFSLPALLLFIWKGDIKDKIPSRKTLSLAYFFAIIVAPIIFIFSTSFVVGNSPFRLFVRAFNLLVRELNSLYHMPPSIPIWVVIPIIAIPFAFYGIWFARKKLYFVIVPVIIGLGLWIFYSFAHITLVIDFHRTVSITSLILMIFAGIGFQAFYSFTKKRYKDLFKENRIIIVSAGILILFIVLSFSYTARENWKGITTPVFHNGERLVRIVPAPPANRYLVEEDIEIFSKMEGIKFLSPGWKGLVIGFATNNRPVFTKPATLTVHEANYNEFMSSTCAEKVTMAIIKKFDYVYATSFSCNGFTKMNSPSSEGFFLYKFR